MNPHNFKNGYQTISNLTHRHVDDFIYRSAHELRGPLATIQGLVNLLRMRKDDSEVDRFVDLIDAHAKKLDERLHHLVYLAQSIDQLAVPVLEMNASGLETHLRKVIEKNSFVDFLELTVTGPEGKVTNYNSNLVQSLLANLVLHVLRLEKKGTDCTIAIHLQESDVCLNVSIEPKGFVSDKDFRDDMDENGVNVYGELLQSSKFIYFYAAKKIAGHLNAFMSIHDTSLDQEKIILKIPKVSHADLQA